MCNIFHTFGNKFFKKLIILKMVFVSVRRAAVCKLLARENCKIFQKIIKPLDVFPC